MWPTRKQTTEICDSCINKIRVSKYTHGYLLIEHVTTVMKWYADYRRVRMYKKMHQRYMQPVTCTVRRVHGEIYVLEKKDFA